MILSVLAPFGIGTAAAANSPTAVANHSPLDAGVGETITYDASGTSGADTYQWDFDGQSPPDKDGQTITHSFPSAGLYPVDLIAADSATGNMDTTREMTAVGDSASPTVALGRFPNKPYRTETVYLIGDRSSDDLGVKQHKWDVDNDGLWEATTSQPFYQTSYSSTGGKTAKLRVTDYPGKTDTTPMSFTVY